MIKFWIRNILPVFLVFLTSCTIEYDAQRIVDKTIAKHGGELYKHSRTSFTFRNIEYTAEYDWGKFMYRRKMQDSLGIIVDKMTNDSFVRTIDGDTVNVSDEKAANYSSSINSVIYFALLPYKLNDPAVIKEYLGQTTIKDEPYYEIMVNFKQEGGGEDHEDTFVYWIHRENYTMDYLAYRFHVNDGGTRFREAYNVRTVNGIRFADYHNYGGPDMETPLQTYDELFKNGELEKVSEINLKNVEVEILN
ncbi:MAG: DUF6503 family protein [Balneolaceae bacterium]|nr:DUF6503 family protein [Balneolaceae bacterium]